MKLFGDLILNRKLQLHNTELHSTKCPLKLRNLSWLTQGGKHEVKPCASLSLHSATGLTLSGSQFVSTV